MSIPPSRLIPIAVASSAVVAALAFTAFAFPSVQASAPAPAVSPLVTKVGSAAPGEASLAQLGVALLVLVALSAAAIGFVKLSKKSAWKRRASKRSIEVLDMLHLGSKRAIAVARVYDRVLVLGLGDGPISVLTELREDEAGAPPPAERAAAHPFRSLLAAMTSRRGASHAAETEIAQALVTDDAHEGVTARARAAAYGRAADASPAHAHAHAPALDDMPTLVPKPRPMAPVPKPAAPRPVTAPTGETPVRTPGAPRRRTVAFTGITSAADLEALRGEEIL